MNDELFIVLSGKKADWGSLVKSKGDLNAQALSFPVTDASLEQFHIINDEGLRDDECKNIVREIVKQNPGKKIFIAVHDNGVVVHNHPPKKEVAGWFQLRKPEIESVYFWHEPSDRFWRYGLEPFIEALLTDDADKKQAAFNQLIKAAKKSSGKVRQLREEILSPFCGIALEIELSLQDNEMDSCELKQRMVEYAPLRDKVAELLTYVGRDEQGTVALQKFDELLEMYGGFKPTMDNFDKLFTALIRFSDLITGLADEIERPDQIAAS